MRAVGGRRSAIVSSRRWHGAYEPHPQVAWRCRDADAARLPLCRCWSFFSPPPPLTPGDVTDGQRVYSIGSRCSTWYSKECTESEAGDRFHTATLVQCMAQCALFASFGAGGCDYGLFNMLGEHENCHLFPGSFTMADFRETCNTKGQPILKPSQWSGKPCPETDVDRLRLQDSAPPAASALPLRYPSYLQWWG